MESITKKAIYRSKREKHMYHRKHAIVFSEDEINGTYINRRSSILDSVDNNDNIYTVLNKNNLSNSTESIEINPIYKVDTSFIASMRFKNITPIDYSNDGNSIEGNLTEGCTNDDKIVEEKEISVDIVENNMDDMEVIKQDDIDILNNNLNVLSSLENGTKLIIKDSKYLDVEIYYYLAPITRWYYEQNHTLIYNFIIKLFEDVRTYILSFNKKFSKYDDSHALEYSTIIQKFLYSNKGLDKLAKTYEKYDISNDIKKLIDINNDFYNNEIKGLVQKVYKPYSK